MLLIILGVVGIILLLFIWSCCVVASECSKLEEDDYNDNIGNV